MGVATDHITAEHYFRSSRQGDRTQLIDGVMIVNEPRFLHGVVQGRIHKALVDWAEAAPGRGIASMPIDVVVSRHDVYGPDVIWFREDRVPSDWEAERQAIPDLVVEVRSPGTWRFDTGRKKDAYEAGGLPELWLVDTHEGVVTAYRRSAAGVATFDIELATGSEGQLTSPLLPGFALELAALFARS